MKRRSILISRALSIFFFFPLAFLVFSAMTLGAQQPIVARLTHVDPMCQSLAPLPTSPTPLFFSPMLPTSKLHNRLMRTVKINKRGPFARFFLFDVSFLRVKEGQSVRAACLPNMLSQAPSASHCKHAPCIPCPLGVNVNDLCRK